MSTIINTAKAYVWYWWKTRPRVTVAYPNMRRAMLRVAKRRYNVPV